VGETVRVLGIKIDKVTMEEAFSRCLGFLADGGSHLVVTPNAEILHRAGQDEELAAILNGADLTVPDGAGVVLASRWLGDPLPEKVAGVELAERLMEALGRRGGAVYLLGTRPEVVAEAARRLPARFAGLRIAGFHHGFFTETEEPAVLRQIRDGGPDLLLAALGSPRQEKWLARHLPELQVPVCIGVGGGIDLWAGRTARAPRWMISANLEWLYRIVRFGRYSRSLPPIIRFLLAVRRERRRAR
jgi:N-acetylglucosaminyldiphosphoundecaprenol N-acetyl-beta-D-mannosaminyltransferase